MLIYIVLGLEIVIRKKILCYVNELVNVNLCNWVKSWELFSSNLIIWLDKD